MTRARNQAWLALLGGATALAGCMADAPRTEAQQASNNSARTLDADLKAAEARGAAEARTSIAEADAELNRQVESTAGDGPAYEVSPAELERNQR
jgi:hypothetical protein